MKSLCAAAALCLCATTAVRAEDVPIRIEKDANHLIAINVSGLNDETARVVRYDLEVLGMEATTPDKAEYLISGTFNGSLQGQLADANKRVIFRNVYQGSVARSLAHAFANDVATQLRGAGSGSIYKTRIAYRVEQQTVSEVVVADYDGHQSTLATHDNSMVNGLSWGPGSVLFYASWKNGSPQVLLHNLLTRERRVLTNTPGSSYCPAVSPDGRHVALVSNRTGYPDLYVCDSDGRNLRQLTHTQEEESSPTWSPDNRTICYSARVGKRAVLFTVNINGGAPRILPISGVGGQLTEPSWSPEGNKIVFTSNSGGFNLYSVPATGGAAVFLAAGEDGAWGPNSRTIIYTRRENGGRVLSLLDEPTKHSKNVPERISGSCSQADWAK